jgi:heme-degrading monooxygenase HmoA
MTGSAMLETPAVPVFRAQLTMRVRPQDRSRFVAAWTAMAPAVAGWPGFVRQDLSEVDGDQGTFVVTSDWRSAAAFRSFETDPDQDALTSDLRDLRLEASMRFLSVVAGPGAPRR